MNLAGAPLTILMYILAFFLSTFTGNEAPVPEQTRPPEYAAPSTKWLTGKVIALDAGHGGPDLGASGLGGSYEKDNTMATVRAVKSVLEEVGARVVLTRDGDYQPGYGRVTNDLWDKSTLLGYRATLAAESKADLLISIHNDANPNRDLTGTSTYYWGDAQLARAVQDSVVARLGSRDIGIIKKGFYILVKTPMPAVLLEIGFISNPREERLLGDSKYQHQVALGIKDALWRYFSQN